MALRRSLGRVTVITLSLFTIASAGAAASSSFWLPRVKGSPDADEEKRLMQHKEAREGRRMAVVLEAAFVLVSSDNEDKDLFLQCTTPNLE